VNVALVDMETAFGFAREVTPVTVVAMDVADVDL
jgi:hypothetical protein